MIRNSWVRLVLLLLLSTITLLFIRNLIPERLPFDGWLTFRRTTYLKREALGYDTLPPHDKTGNFFHAFEQDWWKGNCIGYFYADRPYWPDGDPGLGLQSPLPSMVQRSEIYAAHPGIPAFVLGSAWAILIAIQISQRRRSVQPRGFPIKD